MLVVRTPREPTGWVVHLINDGIDPIDEVIVEGVDLEYGDLGGSHAIGQRLGPVAPNASIELATLESTEVHTELMFATRGPRGTRRLCASLGRLYDSMGVLVTVPVLGRRARLASLRTLACEQPRATLLGHYKRRDVVLRVDIETGEHELVPAPSEAQTARGFFVTVDAAVWAVYASPLGPRLLRGDERILIGPTIELRVEQGESQNQFVVIDGGVERCRQTYPRPARWEWGYDNWSADEESADFFLWLASSTHDPAFIELYTCASEPVVALVDDRGEPRS